MARQTAQLPLALPSRESGTAAVRWLYATLRQAILEGRLRPGTRLPATRDVARQCELSRGTIVAAFERLSSEGYLEARVGSGTYVARVLPDWLSRPARGTRVGRSTPQPRPRLISEQARRLRLFGNLPDGPTRAFQANQPALDLVPMTLWAQVTAHRLRRATTDLLRACGPLGYRPLQSAVAEYLATARGVVCTAEQVVIVSGTQGAIDLAVRLVVNPGDRVAMEDPGYIGASMLFDAYGADVVPVPIDGEGIRVGDPAMNGARLVYVTPAHQFPLGVTLSLSRRLALLEWARATGALIFEDDYDSEYRYSGHPVPALKGLDRHGQVLFAGSFSKTLFPSLRLGYLVVPPDLIDTVAAAQSLTARHAPLLEQAVLCDFMAAGHFGRHVRRMREVYGERLAALLESGQERLAGLVEISDVQAGLQTVGWLSPAITGKAAAAAAARREIVANPIGRYARRPLERDGLHLGFAAVGPAEIRRGVRELAMALEKLVRSRPNLE